ncbi:SIR2 family protein [Paraburkholderia phenazinium]|uniref:SIR2 family protein n=1 Tax=Paraburkholderia phenazinium TaxID=60549 RepID=UPI00158BFACB|nr:SIR2 family protein [Paraburkholderia phenazinium]
MLDPHISLAFSMQSNKGAYALLLGSGISRASQIPTGWDIVIELIRKVAVLSCEQCEPEPAAWYAKKFGEQPDYGKLLDMVAKTPSERQQLLSSYFEPSADEQSQGVKMPTRAHRAIAKLAKAGYIRVIVTTNFDRLMERALEEAGIPPTVLSAPDHLDGAVPLAHMKCCVVKVHGDYLDTRSRNTPTELAAYDPRMDAFLERVFDEFGLVTCGWSADWDTALRANIERAPSRRYSMFWASRGAPGQAAKDLIALRAGQTIPINDADTFFEELQTKIESIEEFSKPHPLSKDIAIASTKRFLSEPQYRIRLSDLIDTLGTDLATKLRDGPFAETMVNQSVEAVTSRIRHYDALTSPLVAVAEVIGRWGTSEAAHALRRARERVDAVKRQDGYTFWLAYQNYPITLITYAALLGASLSDNLVAMAPLFEGEIRLRGYNVPLAEALPPSYFVEDGYEKLLEGFQQHRVPVSHWMHRTIWTEVGSEFTSESEFDTHFDWVEIIAALACQHVRAKTDKTEYGRWFPQGRYNLAAKSRDRVLVRIEDSLEKLGDKSPYVVSALFGSSATECKAAVASLKSFISKPRW